MGPLSCLLLQTTGNPTVRRTSREEITSAARRYAANPRALGQKTNQTRGPVLKRKRLHRTRARSDGSTPTPSHAAKAAHAASLPPPGREKSGSQPHPSTSRAQTWDRRSDAPAPRFGSVGILQPTRPQTQPLWHQREHPGRDVSPARAYRQRPASGSSHNTAPLPPTGAHHTPPPQPPGPSRTGRWTALYASGGTDL